MARIVNLIYPTYLFFCFDSVLREETRPWMSNGCDVLYKISEENAMEISRGGARRIALLRDSAGGEADFFPTAPIPPLHSGIRRRAAAMEQNNFIDFCFRVFYN
jgi:hypothetical protein